MEKEDGLVLPMLRMGEGQLNGKVKLEVGAIPVRTTDALNRIGMLRAGESGPRFQIHVDPGIPRKNFPPQRQPDFRIVKRRPIIFIQDPQDERQFELRFKGVPVEGSRKGREGSRMPGSGPACY